MNICVASPSRDAYSETFIRAYVDYLPRCGLAVHSESGPHGRRARERIAANYAMDLAIERLYRILERAVEGARGVSAVTALRHKEAPY